MRLAYLLSAACVLASPGDRLPEFATCLLQCLHTLCQGLHSSEQHRPFSPPSPALQLLLWTCSADCSYQCQQLISAERSRAHKPAVQFYGKWAFVRILGVQELASVVFSLANLAANYKQLAVMRRARATAAAAHRAMYTTYLHLLYVSCVGWIASAVFHTRDFPLTETLDYFFAGAIIMAQLVAIAVRLGEWYRPERHRALVAAYAAATTVYLLHFARLLRRWDYAYNTGFNVCVGICSNLLWTVHCLRTYRRHQQQALSLTGVQHENAVLRLLPVRWKVRYIALIPIALNLWIIGGMCFELFDAPPVAGLLDGHAMWHLATVYPPVVWFPWNVWDLESGKSS